MTTPATLGTYPTYRDIPAGGDCPHRGPFPAAHPHVWHRTGTNPQCAVHRKRTGEEVITQAIAALRGGAR